MIQNLYGLGDYSFSQVRELANGVKLAGEDAAPVLCRRPDAADDISFIATIPPQEAAFIVPDAFAEPKGTELARQLSIAQLEAVGEHGDEFLKTAIRINIEKLLTEKAGDQHVEEIANYINQSPGWQ